LRWTFLSVVILFLSLQSVAADHVRVRILQGQEKIELTGFGIQIQGEEKTIQRISIPRQSQKIKVTLENIQKKIFWKVQSSDSLSARLYSDLNLVIQGQGLHVGASLLPSKLVLTRSKKMDVIGFVPMRDYLFGVVAKEMPARWPQEALKAQAIAARSYVLFMKKEKIKNAYDVESSVLDQVFSKIENLNLDHHQQNAIVAAVNETEGIYLSNKWGIPVKAYYHSDCGGKTSSSESVFASKGLVGGALDSSCPTNPRAQWSYEIPKQKLSEKLARFFRRPFELFQISKIEKISDQGDFRAKELKLILASGDVQILNANEFREKMGFQDFRSTNFQIQEKNNRFIFSGRGFGHGVGLCQWGTRKMAEKGVDYQKILAHYYPELDLNTAKNLQSEEGHSSQNQHFFN